MLAGWVYDEPMNSANIDWEHRLAQLWAALDQLEESTFLSQMRQLTSELGDGDPVGFFELGAAHDSTGFPEKATELYEHALRAGLSGIRRRRARIQMASSLRNLGQVEQAATILTDELRQPSDELDQAVAAFLALALADMGREREALAISLDALSTYLPRYNRSLARYAKALLSGDR